VFEGMLWMPVNNRLSILKKDENRQYRGKTMRHIQKAQGIAERKRAQIIAALLIIEAKTICNRSRPRAVQPGA